MSVCPRILLSAFADEAAHHKTAVEQMTALAALGLRYYSPRFVDVDGSGRVEHVVDLDAAGLDRLAGIHAEYGMSVATIGSRIGKVKLLDVDDGSPHRFVPFEEYLETEVPQTMRAAAALGTRLIRGFSFYHPQGDEPASYLAEAATRVARIADELAREGLVYGLEVEANLIGQNGRLLADLVRRIDRANVVCIFDGGNLASQNLSWEQVFDEYAAMREHIGWMHIKDYKVDPNLPWTGVVDEDRLRNFVPANRGDSAHEQILRDFREHLPRIEERMRGLGAPGVFLELEPHLRGGGRFGGTSGPDGMGVAARALMALLDYARIEYDLRTMDDIRGDG